MFSYRQLKEVMLFEKYFMVSKLYINTKGIKFPSLHFHLSGKTSLLLPVSQGLGS